VNTVNNIRAVYRPQGLPRQILARASLNANTLATAVFTLDANHVRWQIFDINRDDAKFHGEVRG
ncbi:hypothetical protein V3G67_30430, partial [Escherichia coli]